MIRVLDEKIARTIKALKEPVVLLQLSLGNEIHEIIPHLIEFICLDNFPFSAVWTEANKKGKSCGNEKKKKRNPKISLCHCPLSSWDGHYWPSFFGVLELKRCPRNIS